MDAATKLEIAQYIAENLKLDIKSQKVSDYDSKYNVTIILKLEGKDFSAVQFTM
jgi:hypothetical protein